MGQYVIYNVAEIAAMTRCCSYGGAVAVAYSGGRDEWRRFYAGRDASYVNAYSYALVLSGSCRFSINGGDYAVDDHTLLIVTPLHRTRFYGQTDDFRCLFLSVRKDFVDQLPVESVRQRIVRGMHTYRRPVFRLTDEEKQTMRACVDDIRAQATRAGHRYQREMVYNALSRLYLECDNILDGKVEPVGGDDLKESRYGHVLQEFNNLLMAHYKDEHNVAFYAGRLSITPQYLTSIIKRQTGRTVNEFVFEMLYCEARSLLASSDYSIQQIAAALNFSDQASFCKFFKRRSGVAPRLFRRASAVHGDSPAGQPSSE